MVFTATRNTKRKFMEQGWVKVRGYVGPMRAEMDKQFLEENGIPAIVMNKQDSSLKFGRIDLYVKEEMVAEATGLLDEIHSQEEE